MDMDQPARDQNVLNVRRNGITGIFLAPAHLEGFLVRADVSHSKLAPTQGKRFFLGKSTGIK